MKHQKYRPAEKPANPPKPRMEIVKVVSEHKKRGTAPVKSGHKRVEAIVTFSHTPGTFTRHIEIPK